MSRFVRIGVVLAALVLVAPAFAVDGVSLINQGTVVSTGGFPYSITQSGSYRLSGNLGSHNSQAIIILASNVTLDMDGFTISCTACSGSAGIGSAATGTTIMNGTITGFKGASGTPYGIYFLGTGGKVVNVTVTGNGDGIHADDSVDYTVTDSTVTGNTGDGIYCGDGTLTVRNSRIVGNGSNGIDLTNGLITGATIQGNFSFGIRDVAAAPIGSVLNNVISNNGHGAVYILYPSPVLIGGNAMIGGVPTIIGGISQGNNTCGTGGLC